MFEPGHLHLKSLPGLGQQDFDVDLFYEVRQDPAEGAVMHFRMVGEIDEKKFEEEFELRRDTAFNFASVAARVAAKHGFHPRFGPILRNHHEFDAMFEDIREKLNAHPGEPVDLDRLLKGD
ncbi:DUF5064 family protein [Zestomonas carbonaria]|uniref:DUF5064 family protein n=1 Tax=Zestomonas carbonaria TaxID=2762745 RepID=A0A7U7EPF6_9GAMM|nr:DUF5064 family protein [Pseudomonas carbonaria]CAD5107780.1 hypothetical protein PSEWESI4_02057 [Pseudomonas carbonaria]